MTENLDIIEKLDQLLALNVGDPLPPDWDSNNWGPQMSALLQEAKEEIIRLRAKKTEAQDIVCATEPKVP